MLRIGEVPIYMKNWFFIEKYLEISKCLMAKTLKKIIGRKEINNIDLNVEGV